jgi:hypothetical protein
VEGHTAVEGTEGHRGLKRGQRAVEGIEGRRGDIEPKRGQRVVEEIEGRREDRGLLRDRVP